VLHINRLNKSAARTADILSLISTAKKPLTISEISRTLDIPKSSTSEILYTLVEKSFLEIDNMDLKTFKLGLKIFEIGSSFLGKTDLHKLARPFLEDLMNVSGETVFLGMENNGKVVYIDKVEGRSPIRSTCTIGERNSMYYTGLGKALLAAYSPEKTKEILNNNPIEKKTEYTIANMDDLLKDLENIRRRGYSIDNREGVEDLFCIAAPIYDGQDKPIAAISISCLYLKMDDEKIINFSKLIVSTALNISKRLGFTGEKLYFD